jgi:hypothetical protein
MFFCCLLAFGDSDSTRWMMVLNHGPNYNKSFFHTNDATISGLPNVPTLRCRISREIPFTLLKPNRSKIVVEEETGIKLIEHDDTNYATLVKGDVTFFNNLGLHYDDLATYENIVNPTLKDVLEDEEGLSDSDRYR